MDHVYIFILIILYKHRVHECDGGKKLLWTLMCLRSSVCVLGVMRLHWFNCFLTEGVYKSCWGGTSDPLGQKGRLLRSRVAWH